MWNKLRFTAVFLILCAIGLAQEPDPPPVKVLRGHLHKVNYICYNKAGDLLASCGWDNTVRLWDMHTFTEKFVMQGHEDNVW